MNAMVDSRLRQTSVDPFIEMVDMTSSCSDNKSDTSFKLLPPIRDHKIC